MEIYLLVAILAIAGFILTLQFRSVPKKMSGDLEVRLDRLEKSSARLEYAIREEVKTNRQELANTLAQFQVSFLETLNAISKSQHDQLRVITDSNREQLKERFGILESRQNELIADTARKLEQMREMVEEKLQKTLNERIGQSFDLVSRQLESVQKGLGEMQTLAQDVGGLKKVLSNVKMRGGLGEVRLEMLLEQVLAPQQYEANVKTKKGSADMVEFAIRLPGKEDDNGFVYLPIDAKFPQEAYHHLTEAYELADADAIETASRNLDMVIRKMARDIQEKYIDPPNTTEFGILFLPFEGLFAEVIRRTNLMEQLQRDYGIMVTGPTTLAAILNSLQMGFKTLAIQKRSSEVWKVLGAIKSEFGKFGGLLEKAQKNLHTATNQLDELVGQRTKAIQRRLRDVESLPRNEVSHYLPEIQGDDLNSDEEDLPAES